MALSVTSLKRIITEVQDLLSNPPNDIRIQTSDDDISDITAYILGPEGTPFEGGVWKIKILLTAEFPTAPPKGSFITKIFHPNVSVKGEICVNTLKKDWKPDLGIRHVLLAVRCLLIHPNPESALNEEAGKLLLENYQDYCRHARLITSVHGKKIKWDDIATTEDTHDSNKNGEGSKENNLATSNMPSQIRGATPKKILSVSDKSKSRLKRL